MRCRKPVFPADPQKLAAMEKDEDLINSGKYPQRYVHVFFCGRLWRYYTACHSCFPCIRGSVQRTGNQKVPPSFGLAVSFVTSFVFHLFVSKNACASFTSPFAQVSFAKISDACANESSAYFP